MESKSAPGAPFKSDVQIHLEAPENALYVLDGGHSLYTLLWPSNASNEQTCEACVGSAINNNISDCNIVLDGYDSVMSTSAAQQ